MDDRSTVARADWTDGENDLLVADYFAMLGMQAAGREFVKMGRYRALAEITGRGIKSSSASTRMSASSCSRSECRRSVD